jgi:CheY-like chemotaxis protein
MLPEMDGFTVVDTLKHDRALRDIPVVVISAKALNPDERDQLMDNRIRMRRTE